MAVHCIHPATTKTSVVFVIRIINCRTQLTMQIINQHALLCLLLAAVRAVTQALVAFPMDKSNVRVAIPTFIWMGLVAKHAALVPVQVGNTSVNHVRQLKIEYASINNVRVTMELGKQALVARPMDKLNVRVAIPTIIWMGLFVKHAALVLVQVGNTSVNNVRRLKIEYASINNVNVTMALQKWVNFVQPTMPPNVNHRCMLWLDRVHQTWMNQLF
jgi:hypothetical protein